MTSRKSSKGVREAADFLSRLWPPGTLEGHLLLWTLARDGSKLSTWITDPQDVVVPQDRNVYFGVGIGDQPFGPHNRVPSGLVKAIPGLWADIDYGEEGHAKGKLPPTQAEAEKLLSYMADPTIVVHSGHGLQAYWLFKEPWYLESNEERHQAERLSYAFQQALKANAARLNYTVDMTWDLARVMRLPGSVNIKTDPVPVTVLKTDGPRWTEEGMARTIGQDLDQLGPIQRPEDSVQIVPAAELSQTKLELLWETFPQQQRAWSGGTVPSSWDDSSSGRDWAACMAAAQAGWTPEEIATLLYKGYELRGDTPARQGKVSYTISKALQASTRPANEPNILTTLGVESDEERKQLSPEQELSRLSARLKLTTPITRITMTDQDPPIVTLYLGERPVRMGDTSGLIDMRTFRTKIANTARQLVRAIPNKTGQWDALVQIMLDNAEQIEVGTEGTLDGLVRQWVQEYLEDSNFDDEPDETPSWQSNALNFLPFRRDGKTHISTQGERGLMLGYMRFHASERLTVRQLAPILKAQGWEQVVAAWRGEDDHKTVKRRVWSK